MTCREAPGGRGRQERKIQRTDDVGVKEEEEEEDQLPEEEEEDDMIDTLDRR